MHVEEPERLLKESLDVFLKVLQMFHVGCLRHVTLPEDSLFGVGESGGVRGEVLLNVGAHGGFSLDTVSVVCLCVCVCVCVCVE